MKTLITAILILCSFFLFGQSKVEQKKEKADSIVRVEINAFQLEQINSIQKQVDEINKQMELTLSLILGIKTSNIVNLEFKPADNTNNKILSAGKVGVFIVTVKNK